MATHSAATESPLTLLDSWSQKQGIELDWLHINPPNIEGFITKLKFMFMCQRSQDENDFTREKLSGFYEARGRKKTDGKRIIAAQILNSGVLAELEREKKEKEKKLNVVKPEPNRKARKLKKRIEHREKKDEEQRKTKSGGRSSFKMGRKKAYVVGVSMRRVVGRGVGAGLGVGSR